MSRFIPRTSGASASVARARLEGLLEHDRNLVGHADLVSIPREESRSGDQVEITAPGRNKGLLSKLLGGRAA